MNGNGINGAATTDKCNLSYSEKLGRYMVAAKQLSEGEVILREDALAVGPAAFESRIVCFACMRPLADYREIKHRYTCSKCGVAPLCNRLCENAVDLHTERECKVFEANRDVYLANLEDVARILLHLRLWLLKYHCEESWRQIMTMEAHMDKRIHTPVWQEREDGVVSVMRKLGLVEGPEDDSSAQRLCGVVDVNTFEVRSPGSVMPSLRALYTTASLMTHSCRPNAQVAVDSDFRVNVVATLPIQPGQPVTFNYTSPLMGTIERQQHLQEGKYFRCDCSACEDPFEGGSHLSCILCPRCRQDYVAMHNPGEIEPYGRKAKWQCRKCNSIFRGCLINSAIELGKDLISQVDDTNARGMEILLEKLSRTFHTNHWLMLTLKQKILAVYRDEMNQVRPSSKTALKMMTLGQEMLDVLEIVEPGVSRLKGIMLYELHAPLALLAERSYAAREIEPAELALRLGESRQLLRRSLQMLLLEPANTPEALLAKQALRNLRAIDAALRDANALLADAPATPEGLQPPRKRQPRRRNGRPR